MKVLKLQILNLSKKEIVAVADERAMFRGELTSTSSKNEIVAALFLSEVGLDHEQEPEVWKQTADFWSKPKYAVVADLGMPQGTTKENAIFHYLCDIVNQREEDAKAKLVSKAGNLTLGDGQDNAVKTLDNHHPGEDIGTAAVTAVAQDSAIGVTIGTTGETIDDRDSSQGLSNTAATAAAQDSPINIPIRTTGETIDDHHSSQGLSNTTTAAAQDSPINIPIRTIGETIDSYHSSGDVSTSPASATQDPLHENKSESEKTPETTAQHDARKRRHDEEQDGPAAKKR